MESVWMLGIAFLFPFVLLAGVVYLAHLEDTLGKSVEKVRARQQPSPVRAVPNEPQTQRVSGPGSATRITPSAAGPAA
jgi:hypothetical protein